MAKILFRALATLFGALIAFCVALAITAVAYEHWYLSRKFPNGHGMVLINAFGPISLGAWSCAAFVIVIGTVWTMKVVRPSTRLRGPDMPSA